MAIVGRHVRLIGLVQGVFFRAWAQGEARELGVSGWIRNCPDGSVEVQLTGEEGAVVRMVERLRRGPSNARIDEVMIDDAEPEGEGRFEVRH
jgi:acylphosphatase